MAWQFKISGVDGNTELFGVNIFKYNWKSTGERIEVKDPLYGQNHLLYVYTVKIHKEEYKFAAGEFSNCVWGFYVEE